MKWDGKLYDSAQGPQRAAGSDLINMAGVKKHDHVLDIGCGTGNQTMALARITSKGSVVGLDPSEEMLEQAREKSSALTNVSFVRTRVQDMDFIGRFDLVFSNLALHWVKEQEAVIKLIHRALRQNGRIAFQLPSENFCPAFFEYIEAGIAVLGFQRFYRNWELPWYYPSEQEYKSLLERAGFRNVRVFCKDCQSIFEDTHAVLAWLTAAGLRPYLAMLSQCEQAFLKYAVTMNFENSRTKEGIAITFKRLFAFAEK